MNFVQPSIDPVIFSISFLEIRWYSLAYIVGFFVGLIIIKKINRYNKPVTEKNLDVFLIWSIIGVIIGGRIGYVVFYQIKILIKDPLYLFEIWNGGMSFHGGLLGLVITIYLFSKVHNLNFFNLSDLVSIVAPIGIFLGRIANFINTELIGRPTNFFISIIYPSVDNQTRHPSQIYEALLEGLLLFFILFLYFLWNKNKLKRGVISGLFLIYYSIFRFFAEFLREPDSQIGLIYNLISMGQLLSLPLFVFGLIIYISNANRKKY